MKEEMESPDSVDLNQRIGIIVRRYRENAGLTQRELAERVSVSQAFLSMVENGKRNTRMNLNSLRVIATILGFANLSTLIQFAEDIEPKETMAQAKAFVKKWSLSGKERRKKASG